MTTTNDIETAAEFRDWVGAAAPGDVAVYYRGNLAIGASIGRIAMLREEVQRAAALNPDNLADHQHSSSRIACSYFLPDVPRLVELVQRRTDKGCEYLAIARVDHTPPRTTL